MKKYLEDNFQNRSDLTSKLESPASEEAKVERRQYEGVGPRAKEGDTFIHFYFSVQYSITAYKHVKLTTTLSPIG